MRILDVDSEEGREHKKEKEECEKIRVHEQTKVLSGCYGIDIRSMYVAASSW